MLNEDYSLSQKRIDFYRRNGFVQLDNVVSGACLQRLRDAVAKAVAEENIPNHHQPGSYGGVFIQKVNLWQRHPIVKEYVLCRRFANIAARLAGFSMRLWHDQALFKEPKTGIQTPWHQDAHYWPHTQKKHQISIWIALKDASTQNGCMSFLPETQSIDTIPAVNLNHPCKILETEPQLRGIRAKTCELKAGSCTFHNGLTFHYAGPNKSDEMREAFAILYMPDGTTYSGRRHCCTDGRNYQINEPLAGANFPLVSDPVLEETVRETALL
jgi:phytanoyl-CoA hydroxylase